MNLFSYVIMVDSVVSSCYELRSVSGNDGSLSILFELCVSSWKIWTLFVSLWNVSAGDELFWILISFLFFRFNDFGTDGGAAAKYLNPKFNVFSRNFESHTGLDFPKVEVRKCSRCFSCFSWRLFFNFHPFSTDPTCCGWCHCAEGPWKPAVHLQQLHWSLSSGMI